MSESLKERFITALMATIALFEETGQEHLKRIEKLEEMNKRLQGELHEHQYELGRLRQDVTTLRNWMHELLTTEKAPEVPDNTSQSEVDKIAPQ